MAKSSKSKRRPVRHVTFHEALPYTMPSDDTLPHLTSHIGETVAVWRERLSALMHHTNLMQLKLFAKSWLTHLQPVLHKASVVVGATPKIAREVISVGALLGSATTTKLIEYAQKIRLARSFAWKNILLYAPSLARDAALGAKMGGRAISSRQAKMIYIILMVMGVSGAGVMAAMIGSRTLAAYANDLSSPAMLMSKKRTGTTILDRNGTVLYEGFGAQAEKSVPLGELPLDLRNATIAAEDPSFYDHAGFSLQGTARAAWVDITHASAKEGGSTLTQQLVKNLLLTHEKNFTRKFQELMLSTNIEQRYSKDQILEMYLNGIYYGQGASGVEAAAQTYFRKSARDINLSESALIAGLPLGPGRFDPNYDLEAATGRRNFVLSRMLTLGKISAAQAQAAKAQPLQLAGVGQAPVQAATEFATPQAIAIYARDVTIRAPHFVFFVLNQLREKYGDAAVEQGNITVRTSLDLASQDKAQQIVATRISALSDHHVTNAGLVSIEPATGDIITMVGSIDYNAPGFGNVNVTLSQLQPGSSFKPFAYATAFKKGWHGATRVEDTPLVIPQPDGTNYIPQNYDLKFHGSVTLRHALDNSLNIPALKVIQFAGIHDTIVTAQDLGVTSLQDESRFGPALVLGGGEVSPLDMATAYATFANGGNKVTPRAILSVTDRLGKDITVQDSTPLTRALDARIAYMITHILSDDAARAPEFPLNSPLKLSRPAAAKTGTTDDFRDNWTVGYTPQLSTAVWVGNNDHSAMQNVDGITGAAPIWHDFMEFAHTGKPVTAFTVPAGVVFASVCSDGALAEGFTTGITEVFIENALPTNRCRATREEPNPSPSPDPVTAQTVPDRAEAILERIRTRLNQPKPQPPQVY